MSELKTEKFTYRGFVEYCKTTMPSQRSLSNEHNDSAKTGRDTKKWTGTESIEQAYMYAEQGWDAGIKQLELDTEQKNTGMNEFRPAIAGSVPNIQNYLLGLPEQMYEIVDKTDWNLEELTVYCRLDYSAFNDGEKAMNFCRNLIDLINKLQSKYKVRLVGMFHTNQSGCTTMTEIEIKSFNERIVLNNVAFAFHPSFFRRLWFKWIETKEFITHGYGSPRDISDTKRYVENEIGKEKAILLPRLNDLSQESKIHSHRVETWNIDKNIID